MRPDITTEVIVSYVTDLGSFKVSEKVLKRCFPPSPPSINYVSCRAKGILDEYIMIAYTSVNSE